MKSKKFDPWRKIILINNDRENIYYLSNQHKSFGITEKIREIHEIAAWVQNGKQYFKQ